MIHQDRIDLTNRILEASREQFLFRIEARTAPRPGIWIAPDPARLKWARPRLIRLNGTGLSLGFRYGSYGMGGTGATALAQLVRFCRDAPRLPIGTWRYWTSDVVGLKPPQIVEWLEASPYPEKTACVLCGKIPSPIDWWSQGNVQGPCCMHGACKTRERTVR